MATANSITQEACHTEPGNAKDSSDAKHILVASNIDMDRNLKQLISELLSNETGNTGSNTVAPTVLLNLQVVKLQQPATSRTESEQEAQTPVSSFLNVLTNTTGPAVVQGITTLPVSTTKRPKAVVSKQPKRGRKKDFLCDTCQKAFRTKHQLLQHLLVHTGERKYKCQDCNEMFKQVTHLKQHQRLHTGEKPYRCPFPGCDRAFSQQANQKNHLRCHDQDKPVAKPCPFCDRSYVTKDAMRGHMIKKHLQLPTDGKRKGKRAHISRKRRQQFTSSISSDKAVSSDTEAPILIGSQAPNDQEQNIGQVLHAQGHENPCRQALQSPTHESHVLASQDHEGTCSQELKTPNHTDSCREEHQFQDHTNASKQVALESQNHENTCIQALHSQNHENACNPALQLQVHDNSCSQSLQSQNHENACNHALQVQNRDNAFSQTLPIQDHGNNCHQALPIRIATTLFAKPFKLRFM